MFWDDDVEAPPVPAADPWAVIPTEPLTAARRLVNVLGVSGAGKTTLMARWYSTAVERGVSGTWIDPTGTNAYLARYGRSNGALCAAVESVQAWAAAVSTARRAGRPYNVVLRAGELDAKSAFWRLVLAAGRMLLCTDEMDEYAPGRLSLDGTPLGSLVSQGRNHGVSMIQTVRIPTELHRRMRGTADITVTFQQTAREQADAVARDYFHRPELVPLLLRLPPFHWVQVDRAGRVSRGITTRPTPPADPVIPPSSPLGAVNNLARQRVTAPQLTHESRGGAAIPQPGGNP
jgi:hypothetical protein